MALSPSQDEVCGSVASDFPLSEKGFSAWQQKRALFLTSGNVFSALTIWFSASAVLDELSKSWEIKATEGSFLTSVVNAGFCAGCLVLAISGLADRVETPLLMFFGSAGAAMFNLGMLLAESFGEALVARLFVGFFLAFVYPPGIKLLASWFPADKRGAATGMMLGAFCLGSACPQLLKGMIGPESCHYVVFSTAALSASSGVLLYLVVTPGPFQSTSSSHFEIRKVVSIARNPSVVLTILAYCGHNWELFCVWAWAPTFVAKCWHLPGSASQLVAFAVIAMGWPGAWIGGILGDRFGRARVATASLAISGSCIAILGLLDDAGPLAIRVIIFAIWGMSATADSPQFSVLVTINADPELVGTAVTVQMLCGFLVTVLALWTVPHIGEILSWRWSFFSLAIGPIVGLIAMYLMKLTSKSQANNEKTTDLMAPAAVVGTKIQTQTQQQSEMAATSYGRKASI
eukprot:TRINITY_DN93921_c0_g1_i1.p1 TRINITY_DN93921_c0_g1~~TRINITY_DN93921_c0_g1_i1.p1  ORF type:complete len:460 (-),score=60.02 TRINITY_DN93921_c0_g1_i1:73-1452(-)